MSTASNPHVGDESIGISLGAAVYFLHMNVQGLRKLRQEMEDTKNKFVGCGNGDSKRGSERSYIQSVIEETVRLILSVGIGTTRVVAERTHAGRPNFPENVCPYVQAFSQILPARRD